MSNLLLVAQQVFILFALMGVGAGLRRTRLVDEKGIDGIVNLLILVVTPCLIVDCFQRPFEPSMLASLGEAFLVAVAGHVAAILLVGRVVRHRDENVRRPLMLAAVFSNAGFMGIPLEQAILGEAGVFFGVVYVVVFNLFMWSWGLRLMDGGAGPVNRWKMVVNPGTVGIALGLPLFLLSVKLPAVLSVPVHHLSNLNTPLAMIVIGYSLAGAKLGKVLRLPAAHVAVAFRLVAYPLAVLAALYPFRAGLDRRMALAVVIAASAPVAAMVSMFAVKFGRDVDASVAVVCGSTLLSIVTMPLVIALAMSVLQ
jgi:malate permease and related proteins